MSLDLLLENLSSPALLFFILGIFAVQIKSDLALPDSSSKFIALYLLFSIGFKGGQELIHSEFEWEIVYTVLFAVSSTIVIPFLAFQILRRKLGNNNAGAVAASYGSISAVTFLTAVAFLEARNLDFGGHMIAIMALMEAPAIIVGVLLIRLSSRKEANKGSLKQIIHHSLTNGSVLLILGSLVIGLIASDKQAKGIEPFTTEIFNGFLAIFLLDMGLQSGKKIGVLRQQGVTPFLFAIIGPLIIGSITAVLSLVVTDVVGNRLLLSILLASASYIAVPAAMKIAAPTANPGLYLPMALAVTFPVNISIGMPLYFMIINYTG